MNQKQFQELLRKYNAGTCSEAERRIVDEWFSAIAPKKDAFSNAGDEEDARWETWKAVDRHLRQESGGRSRVILFRPWAVGAIAASLAIALVAFVYLRSGVYRAPSFSMKERAVEHGATDFFANEGLGPVDLTLPDSSRVTLMPGSEVRYSAAFTGVRREVYLEGEAFFHVERDVHRPFLVYASDLTTEVLGTSFRVSAYKGQQQIVVTVKTGKVSVYPNVRDEESLDKQHEEIILTPNQQAIYNPGDKIALKRLVSEPEVVAPQVAVLNRYTNTSAVDILHSLEETYGIDIRFDSAVLANCTLTSDMSEEGFYEQIKILCNALGAEYEISESAVIIRATGCQPY